MINIEQIYGRELKISYYNDDGDIVISKIGIPQSQKYKWCECDEDDPYKSKNFISHESKPVKKIQTKSLDKYRIMELSETIYTQIQFSNCFNKRV